MSTPSADVWHRHRTDTLFGSACSDSTISHRSGESSLSPRALRLFVGLTRDRDAGSVSAMSGYSRFCSVLLSALLAVGPSVCLCAASETASVQSSKPEHSCHPTPDTGSKTGHPSHQTRDCSHCSVKFSGALDAPRTDLAAARDFTQMAPLSASIWPLPRFAGVSTRGHALSPPLLRPPLTLERLHVSLLL